MAFQGVSETHSIGEIPNIVITILELNESYFGKLIYLFQRSCAISAYILEVNPFDPPTVEGYKKNMYRLLE